MDLPYSRAQTNIMAITLTTAETSRFVFQSPEFSSSVSSSMPANVLKRSDSVCQWPPSSQREKSHTKGSSSYLDRKATIGLLRVWIKRVTGFPLGKGRVLDTTFPAGLCAAVGRSHPVRVRTFAVFVVTQPRSRSGSWRRRPSGRVLPTYWDSFADDSHSCAT